MITEHLSFTHAVLVGALASAAVGLGVVVAARLLTRRRTGVLEVVEAVATSGAVAMVQFLMVSNGFGRLHVAYLYLFVTLPVIGAVASAAWVVPAARPARSGALAAGALLLLAPIGIYATHVEPYWLRTDRVTLAVDGISDDDDEVRVGVLADLQTDEIGVYEERAIERLLAEEPDLILLAGDYFQSDGPDFEAALPELRALLSRLEAPGGVFMVEGDIDSPGRMAFMTEGLDLRWLDEEVVTTEVHGTPVHLGGISVRFDGPEAVDTIEQLAAVDEPGVRILLSHRPDAAFLVPEGGADLVVAGHTHGGQVQLPVIGPPITLSDVPRHVAAGGLHDIDGLPIYLSTGVGLERATAPQVRLGVRPSIGVVTLTGDPG